MSPETSRPTVEDLFDEPITRRSSRPAVVNVRGLPYVIPDSVSPAASPPAKRVRSRPALTGRKTNAEEAAPARGAPAERDGTVERAPTSASGSAAVISALRAVAMTTTVAVMAVVTAVVDDNAA